MRRRLLIASCCLCLLGFSHARAQAPGTDFSANPTAGCGPLSVQFKDISTNVPLYWTWDFGNGTTSSLQNPVAVYSTPGTYTVTLIARNKDGANAMRKTDYITVYPFPTPKFTSNLTLACAPAPVQFTDQSTPGQGGITNWSWDFGDGTPASTSPNPSHTYTNTGYYTVTLKVTNSGGCVNSTAVGRYIRIVQGIQPNFAWNQVSTGCSAPYTINFINQTSGPGNLSYNWNLGGGAVPANSTDTSPSNVTYSANGSYIVALQISSSLGCTATLQDTLPLTGNNAVITGPTTVCVNAPVGFTNGSTPLPPTTVWDFGDGTAANSPAPSKTWTTTGPFTVKMVNRYAACADSTTQTVQVVTSPTPTFTATPSAGCKAPLTVTFNNTTPGATSSSWDFGDGNTSASTNPTHTYASAGSFNVTLTTTSGSNCTGTSTQSAFIQIAPPSVSIRDAPNLGACVQGSGGAVNSLTPSAIVNSVNNSYTLNWNAPGSVEGSSTADFPTFNYTTPGTYNITVTATTSDGCTTPVATSPVHIGTPILNPTFTVSPTVICGRDPVTFTTTTPGGDHWLWNFGDGATSGAANSPNATHVYNTVISPPSLTVALTLTNNGCPTVGKQNININPPIPNFGYTVACPATVNFFDSSLTDNSPTMTYTWDFGDLSTPQVVTSAPWLPTAHPYAPGNYTVTLTISDGGTCPPASWPKTITIPDVQTNFVVTPGNTLCVNQPFLSTSSTTVIPDPPGVPFIKTWTWYLDGVAVSTGPHFTTSLPNVRAYQLVLVDTDQNNCPHMSAPQTIQTTGPIPNFTAGPHYGGCINSPITFTDQTTIWPGQPIISWTWNFADGGTGNTSPTTHSYPDTGTYKVILTVTDNARCTASDTMPVIVATPTANFGVLYSFYCANQPLTFIDSSKGYGLTDSWNFGDGSALSPTPTHSFANSGTTYSVTLKVTDQNNCADSITKPVRIQNPIAAFNIYDTTAICQPLQTIFAAHGQYYDSLYWSFGDGTTSTLDSTSHFYNGLDTFTAILYVEGPGGCFDSASRRVLVLNPNVITSFTYTPITHCDSVPAQFTIIPPGYTRFTTVFGDRTADSSQNLDPFHMYRSPNTYSPFLTLTDSTGCIVNINGKSLITVLGSTPFFSIDKHAFCDSSITNFTDFSISNNGLASETFNFGDGSPDTVQNPGTGAFNVSNYYNKPGLWLATLTITTNNSCTETYTDTVRVHQTPHPVIAVTSAQCTGLVQFQGSLTVPEDAMDTVNWAWNFGNGQTSAIQNPSTTMAPGNYNIRLIASVPFGCADTATAATTIYPLPLIQGPKQITTPVGIPITIPFTYGDSVVAYNWTPTANLSCPTCGNPVATIIFSTEYTVTVTDTHNCMSSDSILIKTICNADNYFIPNTFSPNGDGVNDYFYPRGTSLYNIQSLTVFNRWGQMVFQRRDFPANSESMGWDGNFNGKPAAMDTYVWVAEVICDNGQVVDLKGNVTLIR